MSIAKKRTRPVYKFGFRVPRDIHEALTLDKENKNDLWKEVIKKELTKIVEFQGHIPSSRSWITRILSWWQF